jgi:hypothetical protein
VLSAPSLPLTLSSLGAGADPDVAITALRIVGPNADEFTAILPNNTTLAPGKAVSVPVQFTPKSAGLKNAALLVTTTTRAAPTGCRCTGWLPTPATALSPCCASRAPPTPT